MLWWWFIEFNKTSIYMIAIFFHSIDPDICAHGLQMTWHQTDHQQPPFWLEFDSSHINYFTRIKHAAFDRRREVDIPLILCYCIISLITATMSHAVYRDSNRIILLINHTKHSFEQLLKIDYKLCTFDILTFYALLPTIKTDHEPWLQYQI